MNLEQNEGKGFDLEIDDGEEKPFSIPDEWGPSPEEIEEDLRKEEEQRRKAEKKVEPSIDEEDFDIEKEIDDLDNIEGPQTFTPNAKLDDEKKYKEIFHQAVVKGEKTPRREEAPESYIIKTLQTKPEYTWQEYKDFFPNASIVYLKEIYKKKSFAGKVFEVIMVEAAKTLAFNVQGKIMHKHIDATNNIWISLEKIYSKTYRGNLKQIQAALEIIAKVLDGKLKYCFTTEGSKKKGFLVLDIGAGVLTNTFKDFVQVFPEDYKLTNAELIFLRLVQVGLFRNNEQTFKLSTLLEYGKVAWGHDRCKKEQQEKTLRFIERLGKEDRFLFKEVDNEKGKYFVKDLKAQGRKIK